MKAVRAFLLPLWLALLAGCVAPYKPHLSDTAGKVRLKITGAVSAGGHLWPIVDGKCGERVLLPQLLAYAEPATGLTRPRDGTAMTQSHPRAGMQGSPDPARSDVSELQLALGRYLFALYSMSGGYGGTMWQCGVGVREFFGGDALAAALHADASGGFDALRFGDRGRRVRHEGNRVRKHTLCRSGAT